MPHLSPPEWLAVLPPGIPGSGHKEGEGQVLVQQVLEELLTKGQIGYSVRSGGRGRWGGEANNKL